MSGMNLKYWKNAQQGVDRMQRVAGISWAPNGKKFAVGTADRVLFNPENSAE